MLASAVYYDPRDPAAGVVGSAFRSLQAPNVGGLTVARARAAQHRWHRAASGALSARDVVEAAIAVAAEYGLGDEILDALEDQGVAGVGEDGESSLEWSDPDESRTSPLPAERLTLIPPTSPTGAGRSWADVADTAVQQPYRVARGAGKLVRDVVTQPWQTVRYGMGEGGQTVRHGATETSATVREGIREGGATARTVAEEGAGTAGWLFGTGALGAALGIVIAGGLLYVLAKA